MSDWISVEEQMPPPETGVIVAVMPTPAQLEVELENETVFTAAWDPEYGRDGCWYDWQKDVNINSDLFVVMYWKPRPENPMQELIDAEVNSRR